MNRGDPVSDGLLPPVCPSCAGRCHCHVQVIVADAFLSCARRRSGRAADEHFPDDCESRLEGTAFAAVTGMWITLPFLPHRGSPSTTPTARNGGTAVELALMINDDMPYVSFVWCSTPSRPQERNGAAQSMMSRARTITAPLRRAASPWPYGKGYGSMWILACAVYNLSRTSGIIALTLRTSNAWSKTTARVL